MLGVWVVKVWDTPVCSLQPPQGISGCGEGLGPCVTLLGETDGCLDIGIVIGDDVVYIVDIIGVGADVGSTSIGGVWSGAVFEAPFLCGVLVVGLTDIRRCVSTCRLGGTDWAGHFPCWRVVAVGEGGVAMMMVVWMMVMMMMMMVMR